MSRSRVGPDFSRALVVDDFGMLPHVCLHGVSLVLPALATCHIRSCIARRISCIDGQCCVLAMIPIWSVFRFCIASDALIIMLLGCSDCDVVFVTSWDVLPARFWINYAVSVSTFRLRNLAGLRISFFVARFDLSITWAVNDLVY